MIDDKQELVKKWARPMGAEREQLTTKIVYMYRDEVLPIRTIVQETGRSYGAVHAVLRAAGVQMRQRGHGARRT